MTNEWMEVIIIAAAATVGSIFVSEFLQYRQEVMEDRCIELAKDKQEVLKCLGRDDARN